MTTTQLDRMEIAPSPDAATVELAVIDTMPDVLAAVFVGQGGEKIVPPGKAASVCAGVLELIDVSAPLMAQNVATCPDTLTAKLWMLFHLTDRMFGPNQCSVMQAVRGQSAPVKEAYAKAFALWCDDSSLDQQGTRAFFETLHFFSPLYDANTAGQVVH